MALMRLANWVRKGLWESTGFVQNGWLTWRVTTTLLTRACGSLSLFVLLVVLNLNAIFIDFFLIILNKHFNHFDSFKSILMHTIWNWWLRYQRRNTNEISLPCMIFQIPNTNLCHMLSQYLNYTLQSLAQIRLHPSCWLSDTWHYQVFCIHIVGRSGDVISTCLLNISSCIQYT